jgi:DNA-binding Xre family transcriptional regulator
MSTSYMPPVSAPTSPRTPNIDKLNAVVASRRTSLGKLARTVGSSTLYRALLVDDRRTKRQALSQVCVALRCSLDDVSDLSA